MQEIAQNYQCKTGDVVQLNYKIVSIWEQSQIDSIMEQINADPRMQVVMATIMPSTWYSDTLQVQIVVKENPFPLVILIVAIAAIATSVFVYLSLDKIYLIAGAVPQAVTGGIGAVSLGIIAVIAIVVFMIFSKAHG